MLSLWSDIIIKYVKCAVTTNLVSFLKWLEYGQMISYLHFSRMYYQKLQNQKMVKSTKKLGNHTTRLIDFFYHQNDNFTRKWLNFTHKLEMKDSKTILACTPGTYKVSSGLERCSTCPTNSYSTVQGQSQCPCEAGFYRERPGLIDTPCKGEFSTRFLIEHMIKFNFRCSRTAKQFGGDTIWIPRRADLAETFCLSR